MEQLKKVGRKLRDFCSNDIVCLMLVIFALGYGLWFMLLSFKGIPSPKLGMLPSKGPFDISMTNIGRNRTYSSWYYLWALITNIAFFCNAVRMLKRAEVTGKLLKVGQILIVAAVIVMFITNWVIEPRSGLKEDAPVGYFVHSAAAMVYSALSLGALIPVFATRIKDKRYITLICVFSPLFLVTVPLLATGGASAFAEFYPMVLGFILMSVINFTSQFAHNGEEYLISSAKSAYVTPEELFLKETAATTEVIQIEETAKRD